MKIFISWSGPTSKIVAGLLKAYIANSFFNDVVVYVSDQDIHVGNWYEQIMQNIEESDVGILVLTKDNIQSPWLFYEAGALTLKVKKNIIPFCFNFCPEKDNLKMLSNFQTIMYNGDDKPISSLFDYIYHLYKEKPGFKDRTPTEWVTKKDEEKKKFKRELGKIPDVFKSYDYFISYPMRGIDQNICIEIKATIIKMKNTFSECTFFFSEDNIKSDKSNSYASLLNFNIIEKSEKYILIYPIQTNNSSVLLEIGAAMMINHNIVIFVEVNEGSNIEDTTLPFIIKNRQIKDSNTTIIQYNNLETALSDFLIKDTK